MSDGWVPDYTYIGKDGKAVLARDLEDQRDELVEVLKEMEEVCPWGLTPRASALLAKIKGQPNE